MPGHSGICEVLASGRTQGAFVLCARAPLLVGYGKSSRGAFQRTTGYRLALFSPAHDAGWKEDAALSPPPLGSRYPISGRRHDLSTSLAELKPSIFDQYPVGTPSVHGRYAPSPAAAGTRLASLGGGELSTA